MNKINNYLKLKIVLLLILIILIIVILLFIKKKINKKININLENFIDKNNYMLPKTIWMYWNTILLPEHIKLMVNNNKKILGNEWIINILNDENLKNYLDINQFSKNYDTLQVQHKADFIRLKVLEKYGGIWMDASIIINSKENFEYLYNDNINNKYEITLFTLYDKDESFKYHQYTENWFIIAPLNSKIIKLWLEEFEYAINIGFNEYKKYVKDILNVKLFPKIENSDCYLTQHTALQVILQKKIDWTPNILFLKSEDTMFKLLTECNYDNECIKNKIENNKEIKNIPYIKITNSGNGINWNKYFS